MKFPKKIYVQWLMERNKNYYLMAAESMEEALDTDLGDNEPGKEVAIFELKEIGSITRSQPIWIKAGGKK